MAGRRRPTRYASASSPSAPSSAASDLRSPRHRGETQTTKRSSDLTIPFTPCRRRSSPDRRLPEPHRGPGTPRRPSSRRCRPRRSRRRRRTRRSARGALLIDREERLRVDDRRRASSQVHHTLDVVGGVGNAREFAGVDDPSMTPISRQYVPSPSPNSSTFVGSASVSMAAMRTSAAKIPITVSPELSGVITGSVDLC